MSRIQDVYVQYLPWFDEYKLNFQSVKKSEPGIEKRTNMNNAESRCPVKKLFSEDGKGIRATTLTKASSVFTILFFTF
jgi:hypothetical protein